MQKGRGTIFLAYPLPMKKVLFRFMSFNSPSQRNQDRNDLVQLNCLRVVAFRRGGVVSVAVAERSWYGAFRVEYLFGIWTEQEANLPRPKNVQVPWQAQSCCLPNFNKGIRIGRGM